MPGMNRYLPAAAITCAATLLLVACSSNSSNQTPAATSTAACAAALDAYVKQAEANPNGPSMGKPAACNGLDDATLQKLGEAAMAKLWSGIATSTALPTDFPTDFSTALPTDFPSFPTDLATP